MFCATLVLLFILRIRYPDGSPIGDIVFNRYGVEVHRSFRKVEKITRKFHKKQCDVEFLETCLAYESTPKFLRIKLFRRNFEHTEAHRSYQLHLLKSEISVKKQEVANLKEELTVAKLDLKDRVSWLDYSCLSLNISKKQKSIDEKTRSIHDKKLFNLGLSPIRQDLDPRRIITNLSHRNLSQDEVNVLMLGLDFGIPCNKLNFYKYLLCYEKMVAKLINEPIYSPDNTRLFETFVSKCKTIAHKFYNNFKPENNPLFSKKQIAVLTNLANDKSIRITSPDQE